jgi:tetratricopeptide (TPR) repeat protein
MDSYFDLGNYSRLISTGSPAAQLWFDRGLNWCYGFNHEEAIRCFERTVEADPDCAMGYWGIAYAKGPFYNKTWELFGRTELASAVVICYEAVQKAIALTGKVTAVEQALIQALAQRFPVPQVVTQAEFDRWDADYAEGMAAVFAKFPQDLDVITLYAEAMMTKTPWKLWDLVTGEPMAGADTVTAVQVLEEGLQHIAEKELPPHPGLSHMYIHAMEMSPTPERALKAADNLRNLVPDSGHLCHMPSHIDLLCGDYYNAVAVNETAIVADAKYLALVGRNNFYTTSCCHDFHLLMYAAMMLGQFKTAVRATNGIANLVTPDLLRVDIPHLVSTLEGYYSTKLHVFIRFGKWQMVVDEPMPAEPDLYCVTTAMFHYAKGIAQAALGDADAAEMEVGLFETAVSKIPDTRRFFNNSAFDVLAVGRQMMLGEVAYHKGAYEKAFTHLREAVNLDDKLAYTEPWAWMHPPRHALGALLLAQGHVEEAEAIYRADLGLDNTLNRPSQHPNNVWSLHGYVECLQQLGKHDAAAALQLNLSLALARADVQIDASCCCRMAQGCCDG